jgi:hypothetical protein
VQSRLPFAVVSPSARLEHHRQAELLHGALEIGVVVDRREVRGSDPESAAQLLLPHAVLRHIERARGRQYGRAGGDDEARPVRRHALPFVRHHLGTLDHVRERGLVPQRPDDEQSERTGRGIRAGIEEPESDAEGDPGQREHPAQLAAAEHGHERFGPAASGVGHVACWHAFSAAVAAECGRCPTVLQLS